MKVLGEACSEILDGTFGIIPDVTFRRDSIKNFEDNSKVTSEKKERNPGILEGIPGILKGIPEGRAQGGTPKETTEKNRWNI